MKKILFLMILVVGILITKAQTLYIPQIVARPAYTATVYQPLTCPVSAPDDWKSWLCSYRWFQNPARKVEQPVGQPEWVSGGLNTVTRYQLADQTIWLVQHNTTAPAYYWKLLIKYNMLTYSDYVVIDGNRVARTIPLRVMSIYNYTLVDPLDPYSDWIDDSTGIQYNTYEIVTRHDVSTNKVVLQTCKRTNGQITGRLIIELH